MSSYFVRVYYREKRENQPDRLYGVIEETERGDLSVFRSLDALWKILCASESLQSGIVGETLWEGTERRRHPRFVYHCPVRYRIREDAHQSPEGEGSSGKLVNISRRGVCLEGAGCAPKTGALLEIQLPAAGLPMSFPARLRVCRSDRTWAGRIRLGLCFVS